MDVDIDISPIFKASVLFPDWVRASLVQNGKLTPHACGYYPQAMAADPITGLAAVPYQEAEELGYLKVDLLPLHVYAHFETRAEIDALLEIEPDWMLLQLPTTWPKLAQLAKHGDLLAKLKPCSLEEVADIMALIRPGKKNLAGLYQKEREACRRVLYAKDETGYSFKKSHALAYALVTWLQLHLIAQNRL